VLVNYVEFWLYVVANEFNLGEKHLVVFVWALSNSALFFFNLMAFLTIPTLSSHRRDLGITICIARAGGACLNLNCGLILLPMCRNVVSMLRSTFLGRYIPFDRNIDFHKMIGWTIVWWSAVHTLAHYVNYMRLEMSRPEAGTAPYFALGSGPGYTGHIISVCLFLMATSALKPVRRTHFEFFWYTHHLFIFFFGALFLHGTFCFFKLNPEAGTVCIPARSWQYCIGSFVMYIAERVYREINARRPTYISKVVLHPSSVMEIQIVKPSAKTQPGQYIFICIPEVARYQFHPFTLTSTPELPYISVHIRVAGDWTSRLAKRLGCDVKSTKGTNVLQKGTTLTMPAVMVDGPFGSASVDFCDYEVAVLVGAGIGVTPFASILKNIW
jgi:NADPH oxidase